MNKYQVTDTSGTRVVTLDATTERSARLRAYPILGVPFRQLRAFQVEPEQPTVYIVPVDPADETNCEACQ